MQPTEEDTTLDPALFWAGATGLCALAAILRTIHITRLPLWIDEVSSVLTAVSPRGILTEIRHDIHPPFYFFLLKGWIGLFGTSERAVRSLSVVASTAEVAAFGAWMSCFWNSRRVALWAMLWMTLAPLQIYYAQETRSYAVVCLLVTLMFGTFTLGLRSPGVAVWIGHAVVAAIACYTHVLAFVFMPALWICALILRAPRVSVLGMVLAHAAVLLICIPCFLLMSSQPTLEGTEWIVRLWNTTSHAQMIPKSLELLGLGGATPPYLRTFPAGLVVRIAGLALLAGLAAVLVWSWSNPEKVTGAFEFGTFRQRLGVLVLLTLWPLLFLFGFSVFRYPIYVVGRYDILAQPAFLGLAAVACAIIQVHMPHQARFLPMQAVLLLAVAALWPHYESLPAKVDRVETERAQILHDYAKDDDWFLCLGQEGAIVSYLALRSENRGINIRSFPSDTSTHWGWIRPAEIVNRGQQKLSREAEKLLEEFTGKAMPAARLWIVLDAFSGSAVDQGTNPYTTIADALFAQIRARNFADAPGFDEAGRKRLKAAGLFVYRSPH